MLFQIVVKPADVLADLKASFRSMLFQIVVKHL